MTTPASQPDNALHAALLKKVADGKAVDFKGLAQVVAEHGDSIFQSPGGDVAIRDYVVWGVGSVVHAYHNLSASAAEVASPATLQQARTETLGH